MANWNHLEILEAGVNEWNSWRDENHQIDPDLSGANLSGKTLMYIDLVGADLSFANLSNADLSYAEMERANIRGANLSKGRFYRTRLLEANFVKADLSHSDFSYAYLIDSNLSEANLRDAEFRDAQMLEVNLQLADLKGCDFSGARLESADLRNSDLSGALLDSTVFSHARLTNANLTDTNMFATNLLFATLINTNFLGAKLDQTIFAFTDLSTCVNLDTVEVRDYCSIDFHTLRASKNLSRTFLTKIGLPPLYIEYLPDFYSASLKLYPVFISHSWRNKPFARKLYDAMIAEGVTAFFDEKKMKPGDDIYESISNGIAHYDKMLIICSKESLSESWWVDRELDRVLKKERELFKEQGKRINLLIPITIDDYVYSWDGPKAEEIRRYVIGDFRNWQDDTKFETSFKQLLGALSVHRPDVKPPSYL